MHIPDNYLSPSTCAVMGAAMVPVWAVAVRKVTKEVSRAKIPLLGIGAAFSFLIMMFNIPLPGGTTGHAVGGTLIAVLLGPWSACISVTVALLVQALMFGDGGILAFGANCFNMAFILPLLGYFTYSFIKQRVKNPGAEYMGLAVAAYIGLNAAALFTAVEFGIQPLLFRGADGLPLYCPYPPAVSIPAMMIPHLAVAGVAEAAFTAAVFAFVKKASPGLIHEGAGTKIRPLYALLAALVCLSPLGLLAAGTAWGEWGAEEIAEVMTKGKTLGYAPRGMVEGFGFETLFPDYTVNGVPDIVGYIVSAVAGAAILVIAFKLLAVIGKSGGNKAPGKG